MKRIRFNDGWTVRKPSGNPLMEMMGGAAAGTPVTLPHDAMIHEARTQATANQHQTGFYPGGVYEYVKTFDAPVEWKDKAVIFEFEGVYMNAMVYINDDYAGGHPYGYTNFYVRADDFLRYGEANEIKVVANNSGEPNSRWYSGSGIERDVWLLTGDRLRIAEEGLRVTTLEADGEAAVVAVDTRVMNESGARRRFRLSARLLNADGGEAAHDEIPVTAFAGETVNNRQRLLVTSPQLWNPDSPNLYTCEVTLLEEDGPADAETVTFGIRTLSLDARRGLRINGVPVKLRGACIHHDNGLIGAATLPRAEERRCQLLKAAGFNCLRSAHHPMSRAMLEACDREGVLVMDELFDCWTRHKNQNDYAQYFSDYWRYDAERMVAKDYNHPCVIMYSTGNEIQEVCTPKGAQTSRQIADCLRGLDGTRYITNAINGMLAAMNRMGEIVADITGQTPEQMAKAFSEQVVSGGSDAGSDGLNNTLSLLDGPLADAMAVHPILSGLLEEMEGTLDIVGYNYLTARHEMAQPKNPNRVILGAETYPADIARLWRVVEENDRVIGDMTWTGYDYLGEAGIGIFYYDGRTAFSPNWPASVAYIGDIDLIGARRAVSYLREIAYGLRKAPYIAVENPARFGQKPNKTSWMWKDAVGSWTWRGFEGRPVRVNVLSDAEEVELLLNGNSLGRKAAGLANGYTAVFETTYEPGLLTAVAWRDGKEAERFDLETAGEAVGLRAQADRSVIHADGADLSYVTVSLVDEKGRHNMQAEKEITVSVEGAATLQGFGSADPQTTNSYDCPTWRAYEGRVLAVVRAGFESGTAKVTFTAQGCAPQTVEIQVR